MKIIKNLIIFMSLFIVSIPNLWAADYHYEVHRSDKHIIHVVKIQPEHYQLQLVKAQDTREAVSSMAERKQAEIAINGGFFDIGTNDGAPTGSLVIDGKVYKLKNVVQALAIIHKGALKIQLANPKKYLQNQAQASADYSLVSGIPMLINEGKILEKNLQKKGDFYQKPHARTALGINAKGEIIVCVVEHRYMKDLNSMSLNEIQAFIKEKSILLSEQYHKKQGELTVSELKKILKESLSADNQSIRGLTIKELSDFLLKLGCQVAINLDGGGSSTLWINGKVVNATIGDEDEGKGIYIARPISDAIIFIKKT